MRKFQRATGFVGLILLVAFFAPYVIKLPQLDISLILLGGLALAGYDYFSSGDDR
ncbi:MAG: hypothetical protein AB7P37_08465 [Ramlibacter sp.]